MLRTLRESGEFPWGPTRTLEGKVKLKSLGGEGREEGRDDDGGGAGRTMEQKYMAWRNCKL